MYWQDLHEVTKVYGLCNDPVITKDLHCAVPPRPAGLAAFFRDTGKKIFFSVHDPKAENAANLYAEKKWGKHLAVGKGRITFQPDRQRDRPTPELSEMQKGLSR